MAGGFIMRQFQWQGGRTDTAAERAQMIVKGVANLLVDTGTGWTLDESHNATVDDLMKNSASTAFALFLVSSHGEKLMIGYSIATNKLADECMFHYTASTRAAVVGFFASMIPAESDSVFGDTWSADGLVPSDATLVCCGSFYNSYSTSYVVAAQNTNNTNYNAQVITNGSIISFRIYSGSNYGTWFHIGPLVSTLAHASVDTLPTAKMAVLSYYCGTTEGTGSINRSSDDYNYVDAHWNNNISSRYVEVWTQNDLFNASGQHLHNVGAHGVVVDGDFRQVSTLISNSSVSEENRWVAVFVGVISVDLSTRNVVDGDGMKGYLNTDFIRYVNASLYTFGQTFDNGNFVYIGNGVALGWDASNGALNNV